MAKHYLDRIADREGDIGRPSAEVKALFTQVQKLYFATETLECYLGEHVARPLADNLLQTFEEPWDAKTWLRPADLVSVRAQIMALKALVKAAKAIDRQNLRDEKRKSGG